MAALPPLVIPTDTADLDHGTQGYKVIIVVVFCLVLTATVVGLRTYTRKVILRSMWIDDYLAIFSAVFVVVLGIEECIQVKYGAGTHSWDLHLPEALVLFNKHSFIGLAIYNFSIFFVKLTLFFQYYRIIRNVAQLRQIYIGVMTIITLWMISQIVLMGLTCIPIESLWEPTITGKCLAMGAEVQMHMSSIGNIVTDVMVLILPLPVVVRLNLRKKQKIALAGVFCLGFFTCIVSSFRLVFLRMTSDPTYDAPGVLIWSIAEASSGLICAGLPTLKPLLSKLFPYLRSTIRDTISAYKQDGYNPRNKGDTTDNQSSALSRGGKDTYGLADLETGLEQPYPGKFSDNKTGISQTLRKVDCPTSVRSISVSEEDQSSPAWKDEGSDEEIYARHHVAGSLSDTFLITTAPPAVQRPPSSQEIYVQKQWSVNTEVV